MNALKDELRRLYADASKHSVYQNIPDFVSEELGYAETIDEAWRGDRPRLAYLTELRVPAHGERWIDFGANTGFFTLSLAKQYPHATFTAVEANPNHARFIERIANYFQMDNVEIVGRAIGLEELHLLPQCDFLLHLNVLHHAGHDFDTTLMPSRPHFAGYAQRYLALLRERAKGMFFQMGSNWGGDKNQPLVSAQNNVEKLKTFTAWLRSAGWHIRATGYARLENDNTVRYSGLTETEIHALNVESARTNPLLETAIDRFSLKEFPGEFYHRPLFLLSA